MAMSIKKQPDFIIGHQKQIECYNKCLEALMEEQSAKEFVTKDSGKRQDFASGMRRDVTEGKARYDLIYLPLVKRWAELMGRGAEKYGPDNWKKAQSQEEYNRFKESAFRHFMQYITGENPEEDHVAAVFFNLSGMEYVKLKMKGLGKILEC